MLECIYKFFIKIQHINKLSSYAHLRKERKEINNKASYKISQLYNTNSNCCPATIFSAKITLIKIWSITDHSYSHCKLCESQEIWANLTHFCSTTSTWYNLFLKTCLTFPLKRQKIWQTISTQHNKIFRGSNCPCSCTPFMTWVKNPNQCQIQVVYY